MPRPKGSKNLLNAKQLKAELERLKNGSKISGATILDIPADVKNENPVSTNQGKSTNNVETISIKVARRAKKPQDLSKQYGCGNQLCTYESDTKFSICPKCGVMNQWRSDNES